MSPWIARFAGAGLLGLMGLYFPAGVNAQQNAPFVPQRPAQQALPPATGSVSGRVVCGDTQRAARFAQVMLIPAEEVTGNENGRETFGRRGGGARTDLDGNFTATNVAPGDYYVTAMATGYISEGALLVAAGADIASAMAHLPLVHVAANSPSTVNVTLERGSVIAGRVQWDDGSPAAGVQIGVLSATSTAPGGNGIRNFGMFGGGGEGGMTDDRGQFRITGLAPGDYLVRTVMQTPVAGPGGFGGPGGFIGRNASIVMYAPGKIRRTDAQTVTVKAGEERNDLTVVLDLNSLHRVTGHVSAASGTIGSGTVRLTDTTDSTLQRTATIGADGSFLLAYVPAGTYTLSVPFASSAVAGQGGRNGGGRPSSSFAPFSETLSVTDGDMTGVDVTLTPASQASTSPQ